MDLGPSTTVRTMSDRRRSMRNAKRVDRLGGENDRLRTELRTTRSQLVHEGDHEHDVLTRASERKTEVVAKPRGGLRDDDVDTSSPGIGPRPNPLTESGIRPAISRRSWIYANSRRSA